MKKSIQVVAMLALCFTSNARAGGIPVFDVANITQMALELLQLKQEYDLIVDQKDKITEAFDSTVGARGMASIIATAYDLDLNAEADIEAVLEEFGIQGSEEFETLNEEMAELFNRSMMDTATFDARTAKYMAMTLERFEELSVLVGAVDEAEDQKAILDLQARIGAETVLLENEKLKLELMQAEAFSYDRMMKQKAREARLNVIAKEPTTLR